ncbi:hypothetical protein Tco_0914849 [Tanacetum coccineum]
MKSVMKASIFNMKKMKQGMKATTYHATNQNLKHTRLPRKSSWYELLFAVSRQDLSMIMVTVGHNWWDVVSAALILQSDSQCRVPRDSTTVDAKLGLGRRPVVSAGFGGGVAIGPSPLSSEASQ